MATCSGISTVGRIVVLVRIKSGPAVRFFQILSSPLHMFDLLTCLVVMGYTTDGFPFVGDLPGKPFQYICAGFNGHGMPQVFLSAKAVSSMVVDGTRLEATDLPRLYRSSRERLESNKEHASRTAYNFAMRQIGSAGTKL